MSIFQELFSWDGNSKYCLSSLDGQETFIIMMMYHYDAYVCNSAVTAVVSIIPSLSLHVQER